MRHMERTDLALRLGRRALPILAALVAVGCSDDGGTNPQQNRAPNAVIVANPTVVAAGDNHTTVVTLDGTGSSDPDGDTLSFSWTAPMGAFVNGTSATDQLVQVTFPGTDPYDVILIVNDGKGGTDTASVLIGLGS